MKTQEECIRLMKQLECYISDSAQKGAALNQAEFEKRIEDYVRELHEVRYSQHDSTRITLIRFLLKAKSNIRAYSIQPILDLIDYNWTALTDERTRVLL
jgi:hypothetical protein